jgi:hypothetical protein
VTFVDGNVTLLTVQRRHLVYGGHKSLFDCSVVEMQYCWKERGNQTGMNSLPLETVQDLLNSVDRA